MGSEAVYVIQATSAGRASRNTYLFKMGKNEVRTVATSAKRTAILRLCRRYCFHHPFLSTIRERQAKQQDFSDKHFEAICKILDELLSGILSPFPFSPTCVIGCAISLPSDSRAVLL